MISPPLSWQEYLCFTFTFYSYFFAFTFYAHHHNLTPSLLARIFLFHFHFLLLLLHIFFCFHFLRSSSGSHPLSLGKNLLFRSVHLSQPYWGSFLGQHYHQHQHHDFIIIISITISSNCLRTCFRSLAACSYSGLIALLCSHHGA